MTVANQAAQPGAGWDEAQCTAALALLEQRQAQINDLRLAIPRIIEPLHRRPSPITWKLYSQGLETSSKGLAAFKEQWSETEMQNILNHAKESFKGNPDLTESVSVPSHGWVERERKAKKSTKTKSEHVEDAGAILTDEEISRIVIEFRKSHPNLKLETTDDNTSISTRFVSGPVTLRFHVGIEREANGRHKLNAECLGTREPFLAITRCLGSRPHANDLKHILDMIAAYKTIKGTSCAKCGKLLDDAALVPTARRSKQVAAANETQETIWEALHESCLT
ncbi:Med27 domain containing protein [Pyrenophora tritici-repentis]|nr:Med27 domain containing protein [Pyrenophora tritici-repentis]